jgi:hypothetical protein
MRENWVLVYVRPDCGPCDQIFRALGDARATHGGPRHGGPRGGLDLAERSRHEEATAQFARSRQANATATTNKSGAAAASKTGATPSLTVTRGTASVKRQDPSTSYFANVEDAPRKLIIVVGGASVEEVKQMAASMPWIPESSWYADPSNKIATQLKWQAAPVVTGVSKGVVKWSYAGMPPQGLPIRSLMSAWHERREAPPQQPPSAPRPSAQPHP